MTREFQKLHMPLYKTKGTRACWVAVWTSRPFHHFLPTAFHLRVSHSPRPLGIIQLVKCMSSLKSPPAPPQLLHLLSICFVPSIFLYFIISFKTSRNLWVRWGSTDEERDEVACVGFHVCMWWVVIPGSKRGQMSVTHFQWSSGLLFLPIILFSPLFPLCHFDPSVSTSGSFFCYSPK